MRITYGLNRILVAVCLSSLGSTTAWARGVTPYLPLNIEPRIERQIERVLILADKSVVRRPIPAALVLDALPKACAVDAELCEEVRDYLSRYMRRSGVTSLQVEAGLASGDAQGPIPNEHGMPVDNPWKVSTHAFLQPNDFLLLNAGVIAYQGRATPTGTVLSAGFDWAQLDIGFRDHWLSPMTDSSMLISTEAPTMPSVTLSNYKPISPLGFNYEFFIAEMSKSDRIVYEDGVTTGKPRLAGTQLGIEPIGGYAFTLARTFQYGGGARGGNGISTLYHAFMDPTHYDQLDRLGNKVEFGNQKASIAASVTAPGKVPFVFRMEYAGEDTGYESYYLARTDLTLGVDFPVLWRRFDAGLEVSEWQDSWYIHHIYPEGYSNRGVTIGHWFGDNRVAGDAPWGRSGMLRIGWHRESGDYLQAIYRNMKFYFNPSGFPYQTLNELSLRYSTVFKSHQVDLNLGVGRDVFGENYARIAASFDWVQGNERRAYDDAGAIEDPLGVDVFIDAGAAKNHLVGGWGGAEPLVFYRDKTEPHIGFGVRRRVSNHNDLGARIEFDRVVGGSLFSVRALDYRFRLNRKLALNAFVGFSRYDEELPMYGYYYGGGVELTNVLPHIDIGVARRTSEKVMRAKVLATDTQVAFNPNLYYQLMGTNVYLSYKF